MRNWIKSHRLFSPQLSSSSSVLRLLSLIQLDTFHAKMLNSSVRNQNRQRGGSRLLSPAVIPIALLCSVSLTDFLLSRRMRKQMVSETSCSGVTVSKRIWAKNCIVLAHISVSADQFLCLLGGETAHFTQENTDSFLSSFEEKC